jgi:hypothetical protein
MRRDKRIEDEGMRRDKRIEDEGMRSKRRTRRDQRQDIETEGRDNS